MILRVLAAAAAVTAVVGAVVMRHWDAQAGRQVADLTRARASDEWRFEERVAELESDLEESRELRQKLEHRLRAKRTELAGLRNEHASLLRRYATAETERASALEGRRLLEIEAAPQAPALPAARSAPAQESPEKETPEKETPEETARQEVSAEESGGDEEVSAPAVFSPEGSRLFLRANAALARLVGDTPADPDGGDRGGRGEASDDSDGDGGGDGGGGEGAAADAGQDGETQGQPEAADGHERTAAASPMATSDEPPAQPTQSTRRTDGHFAVPTAVAVVPPAPARRPVVEGGFDFFGTKAPEGSVDGAAAASDAALETVQNEDLADVVGQEALALHKAEAEVSFKQAGEESRGVGQVIDLTAHDETEQIDVQGLRSAVS
ncbi:Secreted protein OS=Streptomyces tendae OX=1932 GN=GUR47_18935 PE=4 SV=1 [Streptomyces tendae]